MTETMRSKTDNPKMCIIGFGRMGKRCTTIFSKGFTLEVISQRNIRAEAEKLGACQSENADKSLMEADYIFLAVPIDGLDSWVSKINEITSSECVVMDCCTVRQAANEKLSQLRRMWFGLPEIGSSDLPVDGKPDSLIKEYLQNQGANLYPFPSKYFDRNPVAGVVHFIGMALDLNLKKEERTRMAEGGAGRYLLMLIEHLKSNSLSTYRETQLLEPKMSARRKEVISWLRTLDQELDDGIFKFKPNHSNKWRK